MKKNIFFFLVCFSWEMGHSQWANFGTNDIYNTNSGNVGVGTAYPTALLHIGAKDGLGASPYATSTLLKVFQPFNTTLLSASIDIGMATAHARITGFGNSTNNSLGQMAFSTMHNGGAILEALRITQEGFIGIGNPYPTALVHIGATDGFGGTPYPSSTLLRIYQPFNTSITSASIDIGMATTHARITGSGSSVDNSLGQMTFSTLRHGTIAEAMRIDVNGNVLIGKTTQSNATYMVDVNGNVRANKIVVNTTGADFVFGPGYQLPSLQDLEKFIKENHHLPDITPAKQMQANGVDLGDNQTKLLQKIEELTLYVIELNKKNELLQKEVEDFKRQVDKNGQNK